MREIRVHGQKGRYEHVRVGVGGRMDTLQCAVVLAKLENFDWEITQRLRLGLRYKNGFRSIGSKLEALSVRPDRNCIYTQFTLLTNNRDSIRTRLKSLGVPSAVHYPQPINQQDAYKDISFGLSTPVASDVAGRVMSLPMGPYLAEADQDRVIESVVSIMKESAQ
jgi:UDP-2-acetamido-2-deoxy-ribo-hexuluronate aminotransferase